MAEHETIADIIREARDKYTVHNCNECNYRKSCDWNDWNFGCVECEAKRQSISLLLGIDDDYFNKLLDRLEAAHKRELHELRVDNERLKEERNYSGVRERRRLEANGFAIIPKDKLEAVGNSAAIREALEAFIRAYDEPIELDNIEATSKAYEQARAALAAPPRNCDAMDWRTAWKIWREKFHPETPVGYSAVVKGTEAFMDWFTAPATEQEGGAR